jgi:hypothetical protein
MRNARNKPSSPSSLPLYTAGCEYLRSTYRGLEVCFVPLPTYTILRTRGASGTPRVYHWESGLREITSPPAGAYALLASGPLNLRLPAMPSARRGLPRHGCLLISLPSLPPAAWMLVTEVPASIYFLAAFTVTFRRRALPKISVTGAGHRSTSGGFWRAVAVVGVASEALLTLGQRVTVWYFEQY